VREEKKPVQAACHSAGKEGRTERGGIKRPTGRDGMSVKGKRGTINRERPAGRGEGEGKKPRVFYNRERGKMVQIERGNGKNCGRWSCSNLLPIGSPIDSNRGRQKGTHV